MPFVPEWNVRQEYTSETGKAVRPSSHTNNQNRQGFTLIEVLLVAVVLAVFAASIVPAFSDSTDDSRAAAAAAAVKAVQRAIDRNYALTGEHPANLDAAWFRAYKLPNSPYMAFPDDGEAANMQDIPDKLYPTFKSDLRHEHPFWYNRANGLVRIRVHYQGNREDTIDLFNRVNGTQVTGWDQEF